MFDLSFNLTCRVERTRVSSVASNISIEYLVGNLGLKPRSSFERRIYSNQLEKICGIGLFQHPFQLKRLSPPVRLSIPPISHIKLKTWKVLLAFAILTLTFNHIQSVRKHGLSFGERPLTSGPGGFPPLLQFLASQYCLILTQDWLPTTFTRRSENV